MPEMELWLTDWHNSMKSNSALGLVLWRKDSHTVGITSLRNLKRMVNLVPGRMRSCWNVFCIALLQFDDVPSRCPFKAHSWGDGNSLPVNLLLALPRSYLAKVKPHSPDGLQQGLVNMRV
jgi:hypothetical protein